jgi:KEOPS complex subunit Cgi121
LKTASVKGSSWVVTIGGFRGVEVGELSVLLNRVTVAVKPELYQLMDADRVAGLDHVYMAAVNAVNRIENGTAVSKSLPVETLLTASCQDQISTGFETIGVGAATRNLALVVFAKSREASEEAFARSEIILGGADDSVLEVTPRKLGELKEVYYVSDVEIGSTGRSPFEALTGLLVERGALLSLGR